jgi:hypothetical protein
VTMGGWQRGTAARLAVHRNWALRVLEAAPYRATHVTVAVLA